MISWICSLCSSISSLWVFEWSWTLSSWFEFSTIFLSLFLKLCRDCFEWLLSLSKLCSTSSKLFLSSSIQNFRKVNTCVGRSLKRLLLNNYWKGKTKSCSSFIWNSNIKYTNTLTYLLVYYDYFENDGLSPWQL